MKKIFIGLLAACMLLTACGSFGLAPAQNFDQKLAYGYGAVSSVRTSTAQALTAGVIDVADARRALIVTDQARAGLDAAGAANAIGDTSTALGKLTVATGLLLQYQQYLQSKGVKP